MDEHASLICLIWQGGTTLIMNNLRLIKFTAVSLIFFLFHINIFALRCYCYVNNDIAIAPQSKLCFRSVSFYLAKKGVIITITMEFQEVQLFHRSFSYILCCVREILRPQQIIDRDFIPLLSVLVRSFIVIASLFLSIQDKFPKTN